MATIHGYNGQIDLGAVLDSDVAWQTNSWSLSIEADVPENTTFATTGWRTFAAGGLKGWTGTVELFTDNTVRMEPSDVGTEVTGTFYISDTTDYLLGKCIISGWSPSAEATGGLQTQSITLQGSSDLFSTGG